jgi:hypothetical protein
MTIFSKNIFPLTGDFHTGSSVVGKQINKTGQPFQRFSERLLATQG